MRHKTAKAASTLTAAERRWRNIFRAGARAWQHAPAVAAGVRSAFVADGPPGVERVTMSMLDRLYELGWVNQRPRGANDLEWFFEDARAAAGWTPRSLDE